MTAPSDARRICSILLILLVLAVASVGPLIFPAAEAGYGNLSDFAVQFLLPAIGVLIVIAAIGWKWAPRVARAVFWGAIAGMIATIAFEAIRLAGYHWGFMPGNLPELMGVLLLNRFALGPSTASNIAGWAYHFWNGASFAIIYVLILGTSHRWVGALYGIAVGVGFMLSPVVTSLGVGYFDLDYSWGFPVTVLLAHLAFGYSLALLAHRFLGPQPSSLFLELKEICSIGSGVSKPCGWRRISAGTDPTPKEKSLH